MIRLTTTIIQRNAATALQQSLQRMGESQMQVSSGKKFQTFADDPQAQSSVMQSSGAIRALEQYRRNVTDATARANLEDTVLNQLGTLLDRAKQIAVQEGTSTATAATHAAAKAEVDNLIAQATGLGNTQYAGSYLFGGDNVTAPPVTTKPPFYSSAQPPAGTHTTEISAGRIFKSNHNARELLLDSNVLGSLQQLSDALGANDQTAIGNAVAPLTSANDAVQALVGDLGARLNQLEVTGSNLDALEINMKTFRSNLSDADQAQAATDMISRQTAYQSAMLATSRVLGLTLADYLR